MADVGEHRVARAAHAFEFGLVADHLYLQAIHHARAGDDRLAIAQARLQLLHRLRAARLARAQYGAGRGVARSRTGRCARGRAGFEHITAELADGVARLDAQQARRLRVEIADVAFLVDGVHAL